MWREVTAADGLTMLAMAAGSYYAAVVGVVRADAASIEHSRFLRRLGRLLERLPIWPRRPGCRFALAAQAQFWLEWRQKGWALPVIVVMGLAFWFLGWLLFNRNPRELFDGAIAAGAMLPVGGLIVGLIFGNASTNLGGTLEMGPFQAARPMTSPDMSRTTLRVAGVSVIAAWVIWAAAYLGLYAILLANDAPRSLFPREVGWWYFPLTLLGTWLLLACMTNIGQAGRPNLFGILFCGVPAVTVGVIVISHFALTPAASVVLQECIATLLGVFSCLGPSGRSSRRAAARRSARRPSGPQSVSGRRYALC